MFRSTTRTASLFLGAALALAACGGGSDAETADADTTTTAEATTTTAEETTTTTEATTTTVEETTTTMVEISNDPDVDAFCGLRAQADALGDPDVFDTESVKTWLTETISLIEQGAAVAPDEIAEDMAVFASGAGELDELFASYDYDILAIPEDEIDAVGAESDAASERVDAWVEANCPESELAVDETEGIDIAADDLEALLATEEGRAAVIAGFVAETGLTEEEGTCFFEQLPVEELAALAAQDLAGAPSLFDALAACDISIDSLLPG